MPYPCADPQPASTPRPIAGFVSRPTAAPTDQSGEAVIVVGPNLAEVGGMATVVGQMLHMNFGDKFRPIFFPMTFASSESESLWQRAARHIAQLRRLAHVIKTERASLVHLHTCSGASFFRSLADMWIARRSGARTILHVHGAKFDEFFESASPTHRRLIRFGLERASTVIALSQQWQKVLQNMAPAAKIVTVENAVALPPSTRLPHSAGPCRFLLLARMDEWKGIDDLLDACALLARDCVDFELTLAGPPGTAGDAAEIARKIATRSLESSIAYVGSVHGARKADLLNHADVYVQPSHSEGMPIAVLEALAHGLPIVATQVGAIPEIVADGKHGLTVPARNATTLAQAMSRVAADKTLRDRMGRAARRLAECRFSLGRFENNMVAIYDDTVSDDNVSINSNLEDVKPARRPQAVPV